MKKILAIIALSLFWCNISRALSQSVAIDSFFADRKLHKSEGIWYSGRITEAWVKSGNQLRLIRISGGWARSGATTGVAMGSGSFFSGTGNTYFSNGRFHSTCSLQIEFFSNDTAYSGCDELSGNYRRIWPNNLKAHNAKYDKKEADKIAEKKKPSRGSSGSAFFINDRGLLVTNNHVIEECTSNSKVVFQNKEYTAKLIAKDKLLDFALLKTDITKNKFLTLSTKPPKKLQRIIAAGYPLGKSLSDDLKFTSGIISSLKGAEDDSTLIQIDAALNPGNSGGPIVDEKTGELIAVAVAGLRKDKTEAINFGIKTNSLKNFLDSNQIKIPQSKLLFSFGSVDVSDILENSTVYTYCK